MILAVATPLAGVIGWRLGNRESRATLHGVDEVSTRVLSAAEHVASLRVGTHRAVKQQGGPVVVMPLALPQVVHRLPDSEEVIDL